MKKILILGAGLYYRQVIQQIADSGFYVLAVDRDSSAAGGRYAHKFVPIDIIDQKAVLEFAREEKIDGVMAINDFGTRTAAYISNAMNLPGLATEVVEASNDKGLMRDVWRRSGLSIPTYRIISNQIELRQAANQIGYPCVLKPTDCGGGSRGISVIYSDADLQWAFDFAKPYGHNHRFIVEEYMEGLDLTVESITVDGQVHILAMSDKDKLNQRNRVTTSLNYPAALNSKDSKQVKQLVVGAVAAIGIDIGMAHTEVMVTKDGPKLIEIGARGGGGHLFHTCIEACSGFQAPVETAYLLTGHSINIPPLKNRGAVYRFFNTPQGILRKVRNIDKAMQIQGVLDLTIVKKSGEMVGDLKNGLDRIGFVVTRGESRAEAMERANKVEQILHFEIDPL